MDDISDARTPSAQYTTDLISSSQLNSQSDQSLKIRYVGSYLFISAYMFRTDDQFVPLINGTLVDQPGTRLINGVPSYSTGYPVALNYPVV